MKKFLIISIFVLTNIFNVIASQVDNIKVKNVEPIIEYYFNDSIVITNIPQNMGIVSIYRYLKLNPEQYDNFYHIHNSIYNSIQYLDRKKEKGTEIFNIRMKRDLRDIHYILDSEQYRKYLKVLNITLANKKLSLYI